MSVSLVVRGPHTAPGAPATCLTFDQPRVVVGRGAHADVRLPSRAVSETHAVIHTDPSETWVIDDGSTNGTLVNGQALAPGRRKALRAGDTVRIAGYELTVAQGQGRADPPERTQSTARRLLLEALAGQGELSPPCVVLASGRRAGERVALGPAPARITVGRGDDNDLALADDPDLARRHAELTRDESGVTVRDLGAPSGVWVGGRRVAERRLRDGDEVQLGRTVLRFEDTAESLLRGFEKGPDEPYAPPAASPPVAEPPAVISTPEPAPTPVLAPTPARPHERKMTPRPSHRGTADWLVILLAAVIFLVSAAALVFVLRGMPR